MKFPQSFFLLKLFALAIFAGSCNGEGAAEERTETIVINTPGQDTAVVDTLTRQPDDGVAVETPADEPIPEVVEDMQAKQPQAKPQQEKPKQPKTADRTPANSNPPAPGTTGDGLREGSYSLVSVQGEGLPLVLDMTTECDNKLMKATLQLQNGNFQFKGLMAEVCDGQTRKQEEHAASGSYRLEGERIFLNVQSGEILGDAAGVVEGSAIRLQQISNDEEQQEVDWVFQM